MSAAPAAGDRGRIGPNAITQMAAALQAAIGTSFTRMLFYEAGLDGYLAAPPQSMVDEREVMELHRVLRRHMARAPVASISRAAGRATGDYLLAHRIPRLVQRLLRALPQRWSARLLAEAIRRHAWTFAGSGQLRVERGALPIFVIENCPLCRETREPQPSCEYFTATFERLYQRLVAADIVVTETACAATGLPGCRFELRRAGTDPTSPPAL